MRFLWILTGACLLASCVAQESPKPAPAPVVTVETPLPRRITEPGYNTIGMWPYGLSLGGSRGFSWSRWVDYIGEQEGPVRAPGVPPLPDLPRPAMPLSNREFGELWGTVIRDPSAALTCDELRTLSRELAWPRLLDEAWGSEIAPTRCVQVAALLLPETQVVGGTVLALVRRAVVERVEGTDALVDALARSYLPSADRHLPAIYALAIAATFPGPESWGRVLVNLPLTADPNAAALARIRAALADNSAPDWLRERALMRMLEARTPGLIELGIEQLARPMSGRLLATWRELVGKAHGTAPLAPLLHAMCLRAGPMLRAAALQCASRDDTCADALRAFALEAAGSASLRDHRAAALVLHRLGLAVPAYTPPALSPRVQTALLDLAVLDPTGLARVELQSDSGSRTFGWRAADGSVCSDWMDWGPGTGWRESNLPFPEQVVALAKLVAETVSPWHWVEPSGTLNAGDSPVDQLFLLLPVLLRFELGSGHPEAEATRQVLATLAANAESEQVVLEATAAEVANVFVRRAISAYCGREDAVAWARLLDAKQCLAHAPDASKQRLWVADFEAQVRRRLETARPRERSPAGAVTRLAELSLGPSHGLIDLDPQDDVTAALTDEVLDYGLDAMWELVDQFDTDNVWLRGFAGSPWGLERNPSPLTLGYAARRLFEFLCEKHFGVVVEHRHLLPEYRPQLRLWLAQALAAVNSQG